MSETQLPKAHWYIIHTYSGFENRVDQTIREMMRNGQDQGEHTAQDAQGEYSIDNIHPFPLLRALLKR